MEEKLYEITTARSKLMDVVEDEDKLVEYLDGLDVQIKEKALSMFGLMKNWGSYSDSIDQEIKRLQALKKYYQGNVKKMENYIAFNMEKNSIEKIETEKAVFSFRKSSFVEILDEENIPEKFIKEKVVKQVDKTAIKKAIKEGEDVRGASIEERKNLQIK